MKEKPPKRQCAQPNSLNTPKTQPRLSITANLTSKQSLGVFRPYSFDRRLRSMAIALSIPSGSREGRA